MLNTLCYLQWHRGKSIYNPIDVVANLIIGSIALCLSNLELLSFLGVFALCNWYKAISNLLPIGKRDGAVCLQILRERNK